MKFFNNATKVIILLCSLSMTLFISPALANESTATTEVKVRGIVFTNTNTAASAVMASAYQDDIGEWYEANLFQDTAPTAQAKVSANNATTNVTTSVTTSSNGNTCHRTRSIVMFGNNNGGTSIASSNININNYCPK